MGSIRESISRAVSLALALTVAITAILTAQAASQAKEPPSTNPAGRVIYAGEGQTPEQQRKDESECYRWATEQTRWDPYEAHDRLVEQGYAAKQTADQAQGADA